MSSASESDFASVTSQWLSDHTWVGQCGTQTHKVVQVTEAISPADGSGKFARYHCGFGVEFVYDADRNMLIELFLFVVIPHFGRVPLFENGYLPLDDPKQLWVEIPGTGIEGKVTFCAELVDNKPAREVLMQYDLQTPLTGEMEDTVSLFADPFWPAGSGDARSDKGLLVWSSYSVQLGYTYLHAYADGAPVRQKSIGEVSVHISFHLEESHNKQRRILGAAAPEQDFGQCQKRVRLLSRRIRAMQLYEIVGSMNWDGCFVMQLFVNEPVAGRVRIGQLSGDLQHGVQANVPAGLAQGSVKIYGSQVEHETHLFIDFDLEIMMIGPVVVENMMFLRLPADACPLPECTTTCGAPDKPVPRRRIGAYRARLHTRFHLKPFPRVSPSTRREETAAGPRAHHLRLGVRPPHRAAPAVRAWSRSLQDTESLAPSGELHLLRQRAPFYGFARRHLREHRSRTLCPTLPPRTRTIPARLSTRCRERDAGYNTSAPAAKMYIGLFRLQTATRLHSLNLLPQIARGGETLPASTPGSRSLPMKESPRKEERREETDRKERKRNARIPPLGAHSAALGARGDVCTRGWSGRAREGKGGGEEDMEARDAGDLKGKEEQGCTKERWTGSGAKRKAGDIGTNKQQTEMQDARYPPESAISLRPPLVQTEKTDDIRRLIPTPSHQQRVHQADISVRARTESGEDGAETRAAGMYRARVRPRVFDAPAAGTMFANGFHGPPLSKRRRTNAMQRTYAELPTQQDVGGRWRMDEVKNVLVRVSAEGDVVVRTHGGLCLCFHLLEHEQRNRSSARFRSFNRSTECTGVHGGSICLPADVGLVRVALDRRERLARSPPALRETASRKDGCQRGPLVIAIVAFPFQEHPVRARIRTWFLIGYYLIRLKMDKDQEPLSASMGLMFLGQDDSKPVYLDSVFRGHEDFDWLLVAYCVKNLRNLSMPWE
ncbi:hypothetical protein FB451DRAFT_1187671 [Mycena latifolia]|nr:hypothetical protein FB451DRAFT_1187671 [Mycena latifolia]